MYLGYIYIHDYNRIDILTGRKRELHNKLAVNVLDFKGYDKYKTDYDSTKNISNELIHSPYFKTNCIIVEGEVTKDYSQLDSFVIYMCVNNDINVLVNSELYTLNYGETILFPANTSVVKLISKNCELLEIFM